MRIDEGNQRNSGAGKNVGDDRRDLLEQLELNRKINLFGNHHFGIADCYIGVPIVIPYGRGDTCCHCSVSQTFLNFNCEVDVCREIGEAEFDLFT